MKDRKARISVSFPKNLLSHIESEIAGKSRSEKIIKCVKLGFACIEIDREFKQLQEKDNEGNMNE